jgi:hypothetical protein
VNVSDGPGHGRGGGGGGLNPMIIRLAARVPVHWHALAGQFAGGPGLGSSLTRKQPGESESPAAITR